MDDTKEGISKAVEALRRFTTSGDWEVYSSLVADGVERMLAAHLVEFLPMVYCRLILTHKGVKFANTFHRALPDGGVSPGKLLSSEPLWQACVAFAEAERNVGVSGGDLLTVAARSAEFNAVNDLLNKGSKLEDVFLTPVTLMWPELGP